MTKKGKFKKWKCEVCSYTCKTKKELLEHLDQHIEDADHETMSATSQLEELGVKNPY